MKMVLFICTGNTCRSSMAEGIFMSVIQNDAVLSQKYTCTSAGIAAFNGGCASQNAIKALKEQWDIDISRHCSKQVTLEDIAAAYIVLTMTRAHKSSILSMFPGAGDKVFTLKEYAGSPFGYYGSESSDYGLDIVDPYGMPLYVYKQCAREIKASVERIVDRLESGQE